MSFKFDRESFFTEFRPYHQRLRNKALTTSQVAGLEFLLTQIENDSIWQSIDHISYALGTTAHETAWTFQPINEIGSMAYFEKRYGYHTAVGKRLGNDAPGEGAKYHGRGDVQLTGETNYERLELDLRKHYPHLIAEFEARTGQKFDLTDFPEQAKEPLFAYAIMAFGMYNGRFTGKAFRHFDGPNGFDHVEARRIINGKDKAAHIANVSKSFKLMLLASLVDESTIPVATPAPVVDAPAPAQSQNLSVPVELQMNEAKDPGTISAFDAIKSYGMAAAKALGITSLGGAIASAGTWFTGVNIPAHVVTYILIALAALIFLFVLFGGLALVVYVAGRFVMAAIRESHATKLNLAQMESIANTNKQAVTLIGGAR